MYPETKFKVEKRPFSSYQNLNNLYNSFDNYFNNRSSPSGSHDMSRSNSNNSQEKIYNKSNNYEYHEKFNGNMITDSSLNKTTTYGNLSKKPFPQRKTLQNIPTTPKNGFTNQNTTKSRTTNDNAKPRSSVSAYNLIPKSLLNDEPKKLTSPTKEVKTSNAQNITTNKRSSVGQFTNSKPSYNKRSSVNFENKRASANYENKRASANYENKRSSVNYDSKKRTRSNSTKSKPENHIQKPKFGVIGVISANKSLNEFSKRSSRVLNQQTEEINNLKARIQELTADQDALKQLNDASTEDTLLEFNDKYLTPLLNKMSTYLMKFSSEYNEMIKSNSDFIESQHDRTEYLVELAANLNNQLNNFIEDFECDVFDERTYNKKRNQVDIIADTTSRLNSQLARVVLQLDDFRDSPDFQKDNMTNSIQSLSVILQQLNKAAIAVNERIVEYENCIQQKDEIFIRDQNTKDLEIDSLKHKVRNLNIALEQKNIEIEIKELVKNNNKSNDSDKTKEQKINELTERTVKLNSQLANLTLLFDSEINIKNKIIKEKESQIEKLRNTSSELNHNLSVLTLLTNEKEISNKRNVNSLMETISNLQTKWADINRNLLNLTSTVNDQLRSKNEEIRLNRQDVVYFRNYTYELNNQIINYLKDFFQRIWNKNHENELLLEKNRELINYCSDLNGRVARFTLEVNDLQNENNLLINKLANVTEPIVTREVPIIREVPISVDVDKVEYYKNMAVDLNNRVAMLSLDIDALKLNKFNDEPISMEREIPNRDNEEVIYTKIIEDESTIDFYRNQAVSLNSNLAKLTLEHNYFKNQELQKKNRLIKNSEEKIEYYQQMAANLNTKLALLSLEMNEVNKPINDEEITENDKFEYYQSLLISMNSKMNALLKENEELKAQQTRSLPQEPQAIIQVVNNNSDDIERIRDLAVDLNQRLSVLTLSSNDEIKYLKKQLAQKESEVSQYRNKLASMNRQIIDLTYNSNLERQQYININVDMVQNREINVNENSNYEAVINEKDLIIKQLQEQLAQMNAQNNNSNAIMAELENEKRKNQELNQTINNMRNEVKSISDYIKETTSLMQGLNDPVSNPAINEEIVSIAEYIKETKQCLEDYMKTNTQEMSNNNVSVNEEIVSLANYLKETKRCLEDFRDSNSQEMNSISEYLKDTIKMAEEYKANL